MSREGLLAVLREHRYSSDPWHCRCGKLLDNSDLQAHVAEVVFTWFEDADLRG